MNRKRGKLLIVYVDEKEKKIIDENVKKSGAGTFSNYARKILTSGKIEQKNFDDLKELTKVLGHLSISINQLTKRANETMNIYKEDFDEVKKSYDFIKLEMTKVIKKQMMR